MDFRALMRSITGPDVLAPEVVPAAGDELSYRLEDGRFVLRSRPEDGGSQPVETSEPSDGDIATGSAKLWWEDAVDAPLLHVKGKDSAGTIFTATIPMTEGA